MWNCDNLITHPYVLHAIPKVFLTSNDLFGWTNVTSHVCRTVRLHTATFIVLRVLTQQNLRWSSLSWSHANGFCTLLKQLTARQTAIWAPLVFRIHWRPHLPPHATKAHQLQTVSPSQLSASPQWVTLVELVCVTDFKQTSFRDLILSATRRSGFTCCWSFQNKGFYS